MSRLRGHLQCCFFSCHRVSLSPPRILHQPPLNSRSMSQASEKVPQTSGCSEPHGGYVFIYINTPMASFNFQVKCERWMTVINNELET